MIGLVSAVFLMALALMPSALLVGVRIREVPQAALVTYRMGIVGACGEYDPSLREIRLATPVGGCAVMADERVARFALAHELCHHRGWVYLRDLSEVFADRCATEMGFPRPW